ncbi:MAG: hypothetical protein WC635_13160 [Bacteriovorax sp.]|jgi:hypothetical protein
MIKNKGPSLSFSISFTFALLFHLVVLLLVKKNPTDYPAGASNHSIPLRIDQIKFIKPEEVEQFRRVGIKNGMKKDYLQPDMLKLPQAAPPQNPVLSLGNLGPSNPVSKMAPKNSANNENKRPIRKVQPDQDLTETIVRPVQDGAGNIYFNPKKEKSIRRDRDQDNLKQEAYNNNTASASNPVAQKMSNFEIRYERPEGVSEDELNSDEKAYYSFFKRSYASYLSKLYATYDRVSVERPGIEKDFSNKHILLGRIDYDEKGNIITVKILKSSESDNVHYFFEETLKQLNLPNPPKSFIKSKKMFSTYYQIQIN